jgi:hypothetical protein
VLSVDRCVLLVCLQYFNFLVTDPSNPVNILKVGLSPKRTRCVVCMILLQDAGTAAGGRGGESECPQGGCFGFVRKCAGSCDTLRLANCRHTAVHAHQ